MGDVIDIRLLGRFLVLRDGSEIPPSAFGGRLVRRLVRILITHRGTFVPRDVLADALWPKRAPADPAAGLSVMVNRARRALGDSSLILTGPGGYSFAPDDRCRVDADRFLTEVEAGRRDLASSRADSALRAFEAALNLWGGEPLAEDLYEDWAQEYRSRLSRAHLEALESGSATALQIGATAQAVALAERAVAREPLREAAHVLLARALAASGDSAGALAALGRLRQRLIAELGLDLSTEAADVETRILRGELHTASFLAGGPTSAGNVASPPRTSLVGREQELDKLAGLLGTRRLITLVGASGTGKSQLVRELAARRLSSFPDGVRLAELQPLTDPDLVPQALATALGVKELAARSAVDLLVEHLRDAELLLALEDCQHLQRRIADVVERLLRACSKLRIIATSREPLGVAGETVFRVGGLSLPDSGVATASLVERASAARLFVQRAATTRTGFRLTDANAPAVASVCRLLDGIPLAIELAAARVGMLSVDNIAAALDDRFQASIAAEGVLLEARLQAVIDWSYAMLSEPEQRLLSRLGVFLGGFTLEAAEAVCAEPGQRDAQRLLSRLVDYSLVSVDTPGQELRRYHLPGSLRAFASEQLRARGETEPLRTKHAVFFLDLAERAADGLWGLDQASWLGRLETEQPNVRVALAWGFGQQHPEIAVRLAAALAQFWEMQGHYTEGHRWLDHALAAEGNVSSSARARALLGAAMLAASQGDLTRAGAVYEQAVVLCCGEDPSQRLGGATASWVPEEAERRAAWEMYIELVTRIGIQELRPEEGLLREALSSLYTLFETTRQILYRHGPRVAAPAQGTLSFGLIAVTMLNRALRPLLTSWHAELARYESQRPPEVSPVDHERRWPRGQALRQALTELQPTLVSYANLLSKVAGIPPLTS